MLHFIQQFFQQFNPLQRLAAAIGWVVFIIILAAALVGANLAAKEAAERARADVQRLLAQFAVQIRHAIDNTLENRQAILNTTAAHLAADYGGPLPPEQHLRATQAQFPEFEWIGMANTEGRMVITTDGVGQGETVMALAWFQKGREGPFLGDGRYVPVFNEQWSPSAPMTRLPGFVIATPITLPSGEWLGVLVARLPWQWLASQESYLVRQLESRRSLELLVATADQVVLLGPPEWLGRSLGREEELSEEGRYVVCRNPVPPHLQNGLGWIVVLRESADTALARAKLAQHTVFRIVFLASLIAAIAVVFITNDLLRRLVVLDEQAQAVRNGARENLSIPAGLDEINRIGTTLVGLVNHLQQEKYALKTLNAELDARVVERTARIERLADEARHAAITRERLRLARELHDTLAHSLMALLTEIRLIRKLSNRWSPTELSEELAQAEDIAAKGLAEARAAITQMRHNSVRDEGLGAALQRLLARFQERSGVNAALHTDTQAAGLADERAETVFRIVEEALKNVERHANANTVKVTLRWLESLTAPWSHWHPDDADQIHIEIADDGVGFDPSVPCPGHYGLCGIQEQAELIEATFALHSQPGAGTRIVLAFAI
jgi:signal transduction histidine kinase